MTQTTICQKCYGRGAIELERTHHGIPITQPCTCVMAKDICRNLNKAWDRLAYATKITESPLLAYSNQNVYVTATIDTFRSHLKYVGIKQGRNWSFSVASDSELITAWLANVALSGKEILDPDAASVSLEKLTLVDLVEPPDLLVILLGVKSARNSAMPEVFLEAITHRAHIQKPTWIVDQPDRKLDPSHLCYSSQVAEFLREWDHFELDSVNPGLAIEMIGSEHTPSVGVRGPVSSGAMTLSSAGNASNGGARRVERTTAPEKKKNVYKKGGQ